METKNIILLALVAILIIAPLVIYNGHGEDDGYFGGSDDAGGQVVEEQNPNYNTSWAVPVWEPPSGEIESLLFALQAAIGAIIIGYIFGYWHGGKSSKKE
jgi:cobalt/nickel transport protein